LSTSRYSLGLAGVDIVVEDVSTETEAPRGRHVPTAGLLVPSVRPKTAQAGRGSRALRRPGGPRGQAPGVLRTHAPGRSLGHRPTDDFNLLDFFSG
jgi:hypothetical protein